MGIAVSFRGRSGKAWEFQRVAADAPWARSPGVVIFAAPDAYGWRLIRVVELSGKQPDGQRHRGRLLDRLLYRSFPQDRGLIPIRLCPGWSVQPGLRRFRPAVSVQ